MGLFNRQSIRQNRLLTTLGLAIAMFGAVTCSDRTTGPGGIRENVASPASLSLVPTVARMPDGGPSITLSTFSGVLTDADGNKTRGTAILQGDNANIDFNLQVLGSSDDFTLDISAFDVAGVVAYTYTQHLTLKPGENPDIGDPVLQYAGPDKGVTALRLSPRTLILDVDGAGGLGAIGTDAGGQGITPLRVGWTSRNPLVATVDANGNVRAGTQLGSTFIVGRTATNAADSVQVSVHGPVDKILITPATPQVVRGLTTTLAVQLFDGAGNAIGDRTAHWSTSDAAIATVSATGVVTGVAMGKATIVAEVDGKTATATVTVVTSLDHLEVTPGTLNFASLFETKSLTTKLVPVQGAPFGGVAPTFASSDPKIATVDETGVVTALANGSATITVSADGLTATATVAVKQVAAALTIAPKSASVSSLGDQTKFTATVMDALGNQIVDATVSWESSDPAIATVNDGKATAWTHGSVKIKATSDGKYDEAFFIVSPVVRTLIVLTNKLSMPVGQTALATAKYGDANGNPLSDAQATWSTTTPGIVSVSSTGGVTGLSGGTGHIVATAGGFAGAADIKITGGGGGGGGLVLNLASSEKLPGGTQEFFVVSGGEGPFTWTVNGIPRGNSTFGTLALEGSHAFYVAPAAVPTPSTFDICATQESPPAFGCVHMTINPIPSGGADVIVFNDVNTFVDPGQTDPNNLTMFRNLVSFAGAGPRASQHGVMFYTGHGSGYVVTSSTILGSTIRDLGYTTTDNAANLTSAIDPSIKVIFLWLPTRAFSITEINYLKQFAGEGGRIIFIGEHSGFYGAGIPIENEFFRDMGAEMTNSGGAYDCGSWTEGPASLRPHQITNGVNQLTIACASEVLPGVNDYPFLYDRTGTHVLAAVAKIDITPLIAYNIRPGVRANVKPAPAVKVNLTVPTGVDPKDPAGKPLVKKP